MENFTLHKKVAFLLFVFSAFMLYAQTGIKVTYYDGTTQGFAVQDSGKLYFSESNLLIKTSSTSTPTSLPVSIIQKITFDNSVLSTQNISQNKSKYILYPNPSNDFIRIKSLNADKLEVSIYALDGKLLLKGNYVSDQNIDISQLPAGVYIVKSNTETFKLIKK